MVRSTNNAKKFAQRYKITLPRTINKKDHLVFTQIRTLLCKFRWRRRRRRIVLLVIM
jgi:hypothetical protein